MLDSLRAVLSHVDPSFVLAIDPDKTVPYQRCEVTLLVPQGEGLSHISADLIMRCVTESMAAFLLVESMLGYGPHPHKPNVVMDEIQTNRLMYRNVQLEFLRELHKGKNIKVSCMKVRSRNDSKAKSSTRYMQFELEFFQDDLSSPSTKVALRAVNI